MPATIGHDWGRRQRGVGGKWLGNSPTPAKSAKWHFSVHTDLGDITNIVQLGNHCKVKEQRSTEKDRMRLFTGLTLMPCGLYIWLAARLSLYPPVWLITWRRVSTWNSEDTDKRTSKTKALDNKDSNAQGKVSLIVKGYHKQEKVTNSESE